MSVAVGVLISLLTGLPGLIRGRWVINSQKKRPAALEAERSSFQQRAERAEKEVSALEEQLASLSAALEKHETDQPAS
jgi:chromosome segregation ATPase